MSLTSKVKSKLNGLIRRSNWYNNVVFADCRKFWEQKEMNLDLVNLGSSSAKWAFNYSGLKIKAANWAMSPQTFVGDLAILQNYCSFLKRGATVLIPICPFSSLGGGNDYLADKYYSIVHPISIPHASLRKRDEVKRIQKSPLRYFPLIEIIGELKNLLKKDWNTVPVSLFQQDAQRWIENWKKEFSIYDLHYPLALINKDRMEDSVNALQEIIDFCLEHKFKPILVLPPISNALSNLLDEQTRQILIFDFLDKVNLHSIPFWNYMDDPLFKDNSLYCNSFFLNRRGAMNFTLSILHRIYSIK